MIIPGKITDIVGMALLFPPVLGRAKEADVFMVYFEAKLHGAVIPDRRGVAAATVRTRKLQASRVTIVGFADAPRSDAAEEELLLHSIPRFIGNARRCC